VSTNLAATPEPTYPLPRACRSGGWARTLLLLLAALAISAPFLAGCLGGEETATSDDAAHQVTAQAVSRSLELAQQYERDGEYEEAIAVLEAIVSQQRDPAPDDAILSLGRLYLRVDRYDDARAQLQLYIDEAPSEPNLNTARFLLARALAALGDPEAAVDLYADYIEDGGFAFPEAHLARADLLSTLGRFEEAARDAEATLAAPLPESVRLSALLAAAQAYEQASAIDEATGWYSTLSDESPFPADQALALWRIGAMKRESGDPTWTQDLRLVVSDYPETSAAEGALADLLEAAEPVDAYSQGLIHYRNFRNDEAQDAFSAYLEQDPPGPDAAAAAFYLAATEERLSEPESAVSHYADSLLFDSSGPLADHALWWRGRVLEQLSRLDEARTTYDSLLVQFPASTWAPEAAFRLGFVLYEQGLPGDAADVWADTAAGSADPRTRFWLAKARLAAGDSETALSDLEALARDQPNEYYGVRAADLVAQGGDAGTLLSDAELAALEEEPIVDWSAADNWISPFAPPLLSLNRFVLLLPDERWLRGQELLALGLPNDATAEFRALLDAYEDEPFALYHLARAFHSSSLTHLAAEAAVRLLDALPAEAAALAPTSILRLAYPIAYADLIESAAQDEEVSPFLLLAMIRQESFFDPDVGSPAGALGLMQVIPVTAAEIASRLDHTDFDAADLYRPHVSIDFGAHYLSQQLAAFDASPQQALAAYNAGPGNAARWAEGTDDPDVFLERIEFDETRNYIMRVMENLARYRELYASP
jgi:soluble lytic murein transglycosylase